ncbi:hypothetical protein [Maioricimonas sp. JC845]|uniref:hypothetical protein n=1 Tax=Maioricimonas sp. JC845 TaxID=3232138 RepID=UPI00345A8D45
MPRRPQTIHVLSVRQPYADQIIFGDKWCENRTWCARYRGPLYIHASRWDGQKDQETPGEGRTGAIIGRVELVECIYTHRLMQPKRYLYDWEKELVQRFPPKRHRSWRHVGGPVAWLLQNPIPLRKPIECGGKLMIWTMEVPAKPRTVPRDSAAQTAR